MFLSGDERIQLKHLILWGYNDYVWCIIIIGTYNLSIIRWHCIPVRLGSSPLLDTQMWQSLKVCHAHSPGTWLGCVVRVLMSPNRNSWPTLGTLCFLNVGQEYLNGGIIRIQLTNLFIYNLLIYFNNIHSSEPVWL